MRGLLSRMSSSFLGVGSRNGLRKHLEGLPAAPCRRILRLEIRYFLFRFFFKELASLFTSVFSCRSGPVNLSGSELGVPGKGSDAFEHFAFPLLPSAEIVAPRAQEAFRQFCMNRAPRKSRPIVGNNERALPSCNKGGN